LDPSHPANAAASASGASDLTGALIVFLLGLGFVAFMLLLMITSMVMQRQAVKKQQQAMEQQQRLLNLQEDTVMLLREISAKLGATPLYGMKASGDKNDAHS
jgi:hypothetical protein